MCRVTSVSYTVSASDEEGTYTFDGDFFNGRHYGVQWTFADATMITVAADATGGNGDSDTGIKLSSQEPGAAVQITIAASTAVGH